MGTQAQWHNLESIPQAEEGRRWKAPRLQKTETRAKRTQNHDTEAGDGGWRVFQWVFGPRVLRREAVNPFHRRTCRELPRKERAPPSQSFCGVWVVGTALQSCGLPWNASDTFPWPSPSHSCTIFSLSAQNNWSFYYPLLVKLCSAHSGVSSVALKIAMAYSTNPSMGERKSETGECGSRLAAKERGVER